MIPTPLSGATLEQLFDFFKEVGITDRDHRPVLSDGAKRSRIHQETIAHLPVRYPMFLRTVIPFTVEIEKIGLRRMPVLAYGPKLPVAQAYSALCKEIQGAIGEAGRSGSGVSPQKFLAVAHHGFPVSFVCRRRARGTARMPSFSSAPW
mgnify:CR=1 FL=1